MWFAVAAQAVSGVGNGADNVASDTLIQRSVPRAMLGRVFGLTSTAAFVGGGLAYAAGGPLLDATSARTVFFIGAAGTFAVVLLATRLLPRSALRTNHEDRMRLTAGPGARRAEERNASSRRPPGPFQKLRDALTAIRTLELDPEHAKGPGVSD